MQFCEFANKLGKVLKKDNNTSAFTKTLFEMMIPEEKCFLFDDIAESTFRSYYNGQTNISNIAKKVSTDVKPSLFVKYIKESGKTAAQRLSDEFSGIFGDVDERNVANKLAELFNNIIIEATENKRSVRNSLQIKDSTKNQNPDNDVSNTDVSNTEEIPMKEAKHTENQENLNEDTHEKINPEYVQFARSITNNRFDKEFHGNLTINMN